MSTALLRHIVTLPEWETVSADPYEAIDYMANWDYGEYTTDPEAVETIYPRHGDAWRKGDYVLHRYFDGTRILYRIVEGRTDYAH